MLPVTKRDPPAALVGAVHPERVLIDPGHGHSAAGHHRLGELGLLELPRRHLEWTFAADPDMIEDPAHDDANVEEGDKRAPAFAVGADEDVDREHAIHELGPGVHDGLEGARLECAPQSAPAPVQGGLAQILVLSPGTMRSRQTAAGARTP